MRKISSYLNEQFSQEGRIVYDGRDLWRLSSLPPVLKAEPTLKISDPSSELKQAAQDLTQSSFKYLQQ